MKMVIGVTLTQGKDDTLIEEAEACHKGAMSERIRDLATKGLLWEEALNAQKEESKWNTTQV